MPAVGPKRGAGHGHDADRPVGLEHRELHLIERLDAVLAHRLLEILLRHPLLAELPSHELSVLNENRRMTLEQAVHERTPEP